MITEKSTQEEIDAYLQDNIEKIIKKCKKECQNTTLVRLEKERRQIPFVISTLTSNNEQEKHHYCVWYMIHQCYRAYNKCKDCKMFLSVDSKQGETIFINCAYRSEMALLPVNYMYKEIFKKYVKEKDPEEYERTCK